MTDNKTNSPKRYPCPHCQTLTQWEDNPYKPFCKKQCKLIDLGAWANESYRMAAEDSPFSRQLED